VRRLVSLGLCFTLSLILVFSSVIPYPFTPPDDVFAADMDDMGGDSGGDDSSNDMPKDAPQTNDAPTTGGKSDNDDDNDDDSGGNQDDDNNNDNDNDNKPTSKDSDAGTTTAKKLECPKGQEVPLFSKFCQPNPNRPTTMYELSPGVLPYKGNEVELIISYDFRSAKVTSLEGTKPHVGLFTFRDGTIIEVTIESDSNGPSILIRHEKIIPGSNTPLDRLGVVQVDLPSTGGTLTVPPNSKPGTGDTFLHKITYNDGSAIIASQTGHSFRHVYEPNNENEDKGFWDVYGPNNQLKSTTMADPATRNTAVEDKQDNSVTFHPQGANSYTVYPRAADGTQKTVTVTSEGQPVVTVRDANGNVIPPKE
jgi:hypothetical protein